MNISDFDKMIEEFKEFSEIKDFSEAQYKTIIKLNKKVNELELENDKLKQLVKPDKLESTPSSSIFYTTDEETICRTQLRTLKDSALDRELTLEEAKKVDIYSKLLKQIKEKQQEDNKNKRPEETEDEELLNLLVLPDVK